jgi:hypothetical protein
MILSISIGIIATTPLLVAELNLRPWITHMQGPITPFNIEVVYANFTVTNPNTPITQTSGPTINYYTVVNVTNPSDYTACLTDTMFWAAQNIQNTTDQKPRGDNDWIVGGGGMAKGAWVDGVWYNATRYIPYPFPDTNGTITQSPWHYMDQEDYWMEGVQFYKVTVYNDAGTTSYIYLNMDGTWVDVTGRVTIDLPKDEPTYAAYGIIADQQVYYHTGEIFDYSDSYPASKAFYVVGNNVFDNHFAPGESRLLAIFGSWEVTLDWMALTEKGYINPVDVIQSGNIQTKAHVASDVVVNRDAGNNAVFDTWTYIDVIQNLTLSRVGNSYIYNVVLSNDQMFQLDKYGAEVFIVPRSQMR